MGEQKFELEARLQKKSGDLDSRKKEVAHMMKQKSQITKERNELKTFVDAGKSSLQSLESANASLKGEVQGLRRQIRHLKESLEQTKQEYEELNHKRKKQFDRTRENRIRNLQKQLDCKDGVIQNLRGRVRDLESADGLVKTAKRSLQNKLTSLANEVDRKDKALDQWKKKAQTLENDSRVASDLKEDKRKLVEKVRFLKAQINRKENLMTKIQSKNEEIESKYSKLYENMKTVKTQMHSKLTKARKSEKNFQSQCEKTTIEHRKLEIVLNRVIEELQQCNRVIRKNLNSMDSTPKQNSKTLETMSTTLALGFTSAELQDILNVEKTSDVVKLENQSLMVDLTQCGEDIQSEVLNLVTERVRLELLMERYRVMEEKI